MALRGSADAYESCSGRECSHRGTSSSMKIFLVVALLVALGLEYAPLRSSSFVYEDAIWNEACQSPLDLASRVMSVRGFSRSGALASWCWQRKSGASVWQFHLFNLGLHVLMSALVGILVFQLTRVEYAGWIAASTFALNPMAIESAGYLAGRGELIAGIGVVLACICAMESEWVASVLSIGVGLLGKETAIVAVGLVPLLLLSQRRIGKSVPFFMWGAGGIGLMAVMVQIQFALPSDQWAQWALFQSAAWARLTILSILPFGQTPTHDYAHVGFLVTALSLGALLGLTVQGWHWLRQKDGLLGIGALWVGISSIPRLLVPTPPSPFNEHQFYVPLVGMVMMGVHMMQSEWRWPVFVSEA